MALSYLLVYQKKGRGKREEGREIGPAAKCRE